MRALDRRRFIASTGAVIGAATLAGCGSDGGDDVPDAIDEHLEDANGYDGSIDDQTGSDEVTVQVGTGENNYGFDPAAVRVEAGTTVVWEWTGEGGGHNVASTDDSDAEFESDIVDDAGHTFEQTFDEAGHMLYQCDPHAPNGMLGAVDVVES